jgi:hypothetical protein
LWGTVRTSVSTRKRRELIYEVGLELWRIYNTSILEETAAEDRLVIHYDAALTKPRAELERIVAFAGMHVPPDVLDEAVRVVSPRMRHQRADTATLDPELATLYEQLSREASTASNIPA